MAVKVRVRAEPGASQLSKARKASAAFCFHGKGREGRGLRVRSGIKSLFGNLLKMPSRLGRWRT